MSDWISDVCSSYLDRLARPDISGDVGPAKAVDRLLGIADEEQRTRPNPVGRPILRIGTGDRVAAQPPEYFRLKGTCVLELVYQQMGVSFCPCFAHNSTEERRVGKECVSKG